MSWRFSTEYIRKTYGLQMCISPISLQLKSLHKFKSCMVINGNKQVSNIYPDWLSIVPDNSILTCLAVAAYNSMYEMAKIDVGRILSGMIGQPDYIRCRKRVTDLLVKKYLWLSRYIGRDGRLHFRLLIARF